MRTLKIIQDYDTLKTMYYDNVSLVDIGNFFGVGDKVLKRSLAFYKLHDRIKPIRHTPTDSVLGLKFHSLTVIGYQYNDKITAWEMVVQCLCGNTSTETLGKLKKGLRKTCGKKGCPHFHNVRKNNGRAVNFSGYEDIYGSKWKLWELNAEKRKIPFEITVEQGWTQFVKQNKQCALTGIELSFGTAWNRDITASLDRIDSSKGYTVDNIQWVHKHINVMKRSLSDEEFINWCKLVVLHNK